MQLQKNSISRFHKAQWAFKWDQSFALSHESGITKELRQQVLTQLANKRLKNRISMFE